MVLDTVKANDNIKPLDRIDTERVFVIKFLWVIIDHLLVENHMIYEKLKL